MNPIRNQTSFRPAATCSLPLIKAPSTPTSLSLKDSLESVHPSTTRLQNISGDCSSAEIALHVLNLRERASKGETLTTEDMVAYQKTTFNNAPKLYLDRDYFTEGVFPAIESAQDSIHIAMLNFDGGRVGKYTADLLIRKKRANPAIEIRVIIDNLGANAILPWSAAQKNIRRMRAEGVEVVLNNFFSDGLEHRKSVIIDSKLAFVSGTCFSDRYFGNKKYWKAYDKTVKEQGLSAAKESAFHPKATRRQSFAITPDMAVPDNADFGASFQGSAVQDIQANYLQSWVLHGRALNPELNDQQLCDKYFPPALTTGTTPVKVNHAIPWGPSEMRQNVLAIIEGAQHTLDMEMAYVHVDEFCGALVKAVQRGVKVRLISNSQSGMDAEGKWHINRQFYPELLAGGVRLYELPTFTHRKLVVADKRVVFLSTGNPEWNSWERGWDELVFIDSPALAADIEKRVFNRGFAPDYGKEVTLETLQNESLLTRLKTFLINGLMNLVMSIYLWGTGSHRGREARRNYVGPSPVQKTKSMPLPSTSAPALLCLTPPLKRCA